MEVSSQMLQ
ncbi:unnamed protein product [Linum tenue]|uniref:Uncharacterized protein n=1 Tax=Linum tenue TaxID=586396 RepID=A0AAV0IXM5_9ROSI|nr:unnamed protein product [Linum tenue]